MRTTLVVVSLGLLSSIASAQPGAEALAESAQPITIIETYHPKVNRIEWHPIEGDQGISDSDFYRRVGRDDLADEVYRHQVKAAIGGLGVAAAMGFTIYEIVQANQLPDLEMCFGQTSFGGLDACTQQARANADAEGEKHVMPAVLGGAASLGLLAYVIYQAATVPSMSDAEAHALAARYNATHVAPYATPGGGGVSVGGSF